MSVEPSGADRKMLFVLLAAERPGPLWGHFTRKLSQDTAYSSNEASPLCGFAPRNVGGGGGGDTQSQPQWPRPTLRPNSRPSSRNGVGRHVPPSQAGDGHIDLSGPGILSQAAPASSWAPLGRNERRKRGVGLCYVTSFLGVRGPSLSVIAQRCRERLGEGEAAFFPPLLSLLQTSADLLGRRCFPSASAPSRHPR